MKKGIPVKKGPVKKVPSPKNPVLYNLAGLTIVIVTGIIIYSNSFGCSWHLDDFYNIVDNPKIRDLSDLATWWNYTHTRLVAFYSFALNYHFHQTEVWGYHLVNLCIHLANACLVGWLTLLICSSPALKGQEFVRHKKVIAFVTAMLFVSHPLATQSVTYIVQRLASMVAMFYFLSISLYIMARISDKGNLYKLLWFAGAFISAILAMLTKENAFTLPFAILLVEFFFLRTKKQFINFRDYRVILSILLFLAVLLIIPLSYPIKIFSPIFRPGSTEPFLTPFSYFLTQFNVIVKYIQLLFLPVSQNLDYDFPISNSFFEIRTLLSFLFLIALIILAIFLFKKQRIISFGIFWFFLTLSIESSVIPIADVIFEHRTYLPSFGFFLIVSSAVTVLFLDKYKALAIGIWTVMIVSNSILTYERNKVWKDELTLWSDNVIKSPNKARPLTNRGWAYRNLDDYDNAMADYSRAIEIDPSYGQSWLNRGYIFSKRGQWDKAVADFSRAISLDPGFTDAYSNRSAAYGNMGEWDKAIVDATKVIELNPGYFMAYVNRGIGYSNIKQHDKAILDYSKAIELNPASAEAYNNRANVYGEVGQTDKAIADYSRAIEINPDYKDAYINRGFTYDKLGRWENAIADYTSALAIDPKNAAGYYNRALAYMNLGKVDQAIADYSTAIRIAPNFIQAYVNRGLAYGKLGQYDKAVDDYNSALGIDPNFAIARNNLAIAISHLRRGTKN